MVLRPGQMVRRARTWAPVLMGLTAAVICAAFVLDNPLGEGLEGDPLEIAGLIGGAGLVVWLLGRRLLSDPGEAGDVSGDESTYTDGLFRRMQIFTACYVALAHGSNDVANALGPVAALYLLTQHALATGQADMPVYILALGGVGIALGIGLLGHRVIRTVGERITPLDNPKGFASSFSIATTVMASSNLGLPVSSTHVAVGSVTGVGLAGGRDNVSFGLLVKIFINWVVTLPAAAGLCVAIYWLLGRLLG
jgi:PiT family inorganic phosphate transporter